MMNDTSATNPIQLFIDREKFTATDWLNRGLLPPDGAIRIELVRRINACAIDIEKGSKQHLSKNALQRLLTRGLETFNQLELDTESKELVAEYFYTLASCVNVDLANDVSIWLYGVGITALRVATPQAALATLEQKCPGCGVTLKSVIIDKKSGIPALWLVAKCTKCMTHTLLELPADVKAFSVENYMIVEQLRRDEYAEKEASARVARYL
jgi:hypothetical protein